MQFEKEEWQARALASMHSFIVLFRRLPDTPAHKFRLLIIPAAAHSKGCQKEYLHSVSHDSRYGFKHGYLHIILNNNPLSFRQFCDPSGK